MLFSDANFPLFKNISKIKWKYSKHALHNSRLQNHLCCAMRVHEDATFLGHCDTDFAVSHHILHFHVIKFESNGVRYSNP